MDGLDLDFIGFFRLWIELEFNKHNKCLITQGMIG